MGPPVVNCWWFISCPIWRDLVLSILYRPCELELFPFHTQSLRNRGHQREEPFCQTSPAPDVIFFAFHRYSRCCIQSKVTFLVKQEKVTIKLGRRREVLQRFRITVTENGKCQLQNDNFSKEGSKLITTVRTNSEGLNWCEISHFCTGNKQWTTSIEKIVT